MTRIGLLAQSPISERLQGLRQGFRRQPSDYSDLILLLWFVVGAAAVLLVLMLISRRRQRQNLNLVSSRPMRLFNRSLRHLGVPWVARVIMRRVANYAGHPHPTAMLLCSDLFERNVSDWIRRAVPTWMAAFIDQHVASVRERAFTDGDGPIASP